MYKKSVIINRAVPGSGKSTISECIMDALKACGYSSSIHSTDSYFITEDRRYGFTPEKLAEYHRMNLEAFTKSLRDGVDLVICDNTNLSSWQSEPYTDAARKYDYQIILIDYPPREPEKHIETQIPSPEKPDAHEVPPDSILDKIEEYHRHKNLLDKKNPVDPEKNRREVWDNDIMDVRLTDQLLNHYDLDYLITIQPDEYHTIKDSIGERIINLMKINRENGED